MNPRLSNIFVPFLVAILGLAYGAYQYRSYDDGRRQNLIQYITTVRTSLNVDHINSLSANQSDLINSSYLRLKQQLTNMGESYPFVRYLYLMRLVGDQIVFLVDTQPPRFTDTAELAMPGEIYEDAQESLFRLFSQDHPVTVGPETDKWGTFVSALTTVTDKQGNIIAVIGADIESSNWDRQVYLHLLPTLFFTLFSSLLSFFLVSSYHKRQQYQQKLEHLALVLETSHDAIATISPDGVVMTWNQGAIAIFGYTATEAIGKKVTDLVYPGKQLDDYQKIYQLPANGQQLVNHKAIRRTKTGKMVVLLVSATPIYQNGEFIGTTVIGKDITQDAGKESVLVARNQELEKLNQSMVDREIEMVNLKNKIKELEASRKK